MGLRDKNFKSEATNFRNWNLTKERIQFAGPRARTVRALSPDAAAAYPPDHFDWVYIDALHTYDALLRDLDAWWEKVRPGGLLAGDDYGDVSDTEYVSDQRYVAKFGTLHRWSENKWGVISAVRDFARRKGVPVHVTWLLDCYTHPAWWVVRPFQL